LKGLRYLNPFLIRDVVREARTLHGEGGPRAVRLAGVEGPDGWILPTARPTIEVVGRRHGKIQRLQPDLPIPPLFGLTWRVARRLLG
jgi:hypothetical protein